MGRLIWWIGAAILFGIVSGALYTWMSPRRERRLVLLLRSMLIYVCIGLVAVYLLKLFI